MDMNELSVIVGVGIGLISGIQILFGLRRDGREARHQQAKAGYELVDALFDDEEAGPLLAALDTGLEHSHLTSRRTQEAQKIAQAFDYAFGNGRDQVQPHLTAVRIQFDAVLYYLDRFEHAIRADITTFDDVQSSWRYYDALLSRYAMVIDQYAEDTGYGRAVAFLHRYPEWRRAVAQTRPGAAVRS